MKNPKIKIFVESQKEPRTFIEDDNDYKFLRDKKLIEGDGEIESKFVGEVITPHNTYFSLPKKFTKTEENIKLIKQVLREFKDTRTKEGKTIVYNKLFEPSKGAEFKSDEYYYKELKRFFLDYVTYEFIYPLKKLKVHAGSPPKGGKLDVLSSVQSRKRFGVGMTYDIKDVKNSDEWSIDDIYYQTLIDLMNKVNASDSDRRDIAEMKDYLDKEGYEILLDERGNETTLDKKISDITPDGIIKEINKSEVGYIHYPIRDTLIEYYEKLKLKESIFNINVIYTTNFEKVWEELAKKALYHDVEFESKLKDNFSKVETQSKWVRTSEIEDFINQLKDKNPQISEENPNIVEWVDKGLEPDIFSSIKLQSGKFLRFIGDAKYYNDANSDFRKELNDYNDAMENKYPMCIFVCSTINQTGPRGATVYRKRTSNIDPKKEIIIFYLSTEKAIEVALNRKLGKNDFTLISEIHKLINKYTRRRGTNFLGGF